MDAGKIRCPRCAGLKKVYKIGKGDGGYSQVNSGGLLVSCPMCLGEGSIKKLEDAAPEVVEEVTKKVTNKKKKAEITAEL